LCVDITKDCILTAKFTSPQLLWCGPVESLKNMHQPQHGHYTLVATGPVLFAGYNTLSVNKITSFINEDIYRHYKCLHVVDYYY